MCIDSTPPYFFMHTIEFGLIGDKLSHSYSAEYFNDKFYRLGLNARYLLFPINSIGLLPELLKEHEHLMGLNVTIPYKRKVIPFLEGMDFVSTAIGAVNTICISRTGTGNATLYGYNTDAPAFEKSVMPMLDACTHGALILGTGGAASTVRYVLESKGLECKLVSRTPTDVTIGYDEIDKRILARYPLIVNCTPLGTYPNVDSAPPIPYHLLNSYNKAFDLVYNPDCTMFMRRCAEHGCLIRNGLQMLHTQADLAWSKFSLQIQGK